MIDQIGVGFLGAGPVTQAIHLPTLARLTDIFRVVTVMDVSQDIARSVAGRVDAQYTSDANAMFEDPAVEVIAICSPHHFHAEQVIAACRAGKKAVLCEKPFATTPDQAEAIAVVAAETRVPILVGAMHTFDPGWRAAMRQLESGSTARLIRSSIVLPPNARFEDFATEIITRPPPPHPDFDDPDVVAALVNGNVMGLGIHDLPLIRSLLTDWRQLDVLAAEVVRPNGYAIVGRCGDQVVELHALMSQNWAPRWIVEVFTDDRVITVEFTPSYVYAGSAVARVDTLDSTTIYGPTDHNGYECEWRELAEVARGQRPTVDTAALVDDLRFALSIAGSAAERARTSAARISA